MSKLINLINIDSIQEAEDILKAAGTEDLFEKAKHQDGDMHPNGKWVWVSSANGGKGDWRTKGGRAHTKHSAGGGNAGTGSTTTTQQKPNTQVVETTQKIKRDEDFKKLMRNASDTTLNKIVSGKIKASDRDKKLVQEILDDRKKPTVGDVSKLNAQQKSMVNNVMDKGFRISSNKYNDKSKVELKKTDKGNWRCYYDGRDIGTTINGNLITDSVAKKIGWYKKEVKANTTSSDSTTTDKPKKRPIAVGTNGPEKRTTQKKESSSVDSKLKKIYDVVSKQKLSTYKQYNGKITISHEWKLVDNVKRPIDGSSYKAVVLYRNVKGKYPWSEKKVDKSSMEAILKIEGNEIRLLNALEDFSPNRNGEEIPSDKLKDTLDFLSKHINPGGGFTKTENLEKYLAHDIKDWK